MSRKEKRAYLKAIQSRYKKASRAQKSRILDEFCAVCGYNRKYAIRALSKRPARVRRKPGRRPRYEADRIIGHLRNQIPVRTDNWDINQPGYMEADTVAHCGNSLAGDFVWSLTMTDIQTSWTENRAVWNKGSAGVLEQIKNIEKSLPFEILGYDCDNGSEFLNHHLIRYFVNRDKAVQFTRSRAYRKNDNAHVEQKNWTHVRHLFGYDRFDRPELVEMMNDLYRNEWSQYQNHFCPVMKLVEKTRINSRYHRRYDKPMTPYYRLMGSGILSEETKNRLREERRGLNPFALKRAIEKKLKKILRLVTVSTKPRKRI